jgi:hypothetical protein
MPLATATDLTKTFRVAERGRGFMAALVAVVLLFSAARGDSPGPDPIGPQEPTADEQLGIYELNLARRDPVAYGDRIGLDLSGVEPRPPLALKPHLTGAARYHTIDMLLNDYFAHVSPWSGKGANQMAVDHGYDLFGYGLDHDWGEENWIESIAYGLNAAPDFPAALAGLIRDDGVPNLGHRVHLLGMESFYTSHREVGCGRATDGSRRYYAVQTAYSGASDLFLTGVVHADLDGDRRYGRGEGLGGVTVAAGDFTTESLSEGGFALRVPPGEYVVTCSGGPFEGEATAEVEVLDRSVEVDFRSGSEHGVVDFADLVPVPLFATAEPSSGLAPLEVTFAASGPEESEECEWTFPSGDVESGPEVVRTFDEPGLYPVRAGLGGGEEALVLVVVGGAAGAGAGTTPPDDDALSVEKASVRAVFTKTGADQISFRASLTMPEGFVPGVHPVEVSAAGATVALSLDAKGRAADAAGNRVSLRVKLPKDGGPLGPGVRACLTVSLRGDFRAMLGAAGFRDTDFSGAVSGVPFAFLLHELPWVATAAMTVSSRAGRKAAGALR